MIGGFGVIIYGGPLPLMLTVSPSYQGTLTEGEGSVQLTSSLG
jgi:hypothetical protein